MGPIGLVRYLLRGFGMLVEVLAVPAESVRAPGFTDTSRLLRVEPSGALTSLLDGALRVVDVSFGPDRVDVTVRVPLLHERRSPLSHQEQRVVRRLLHGQSQKEIAYDLQLSPTTVSAHVHRSLNKLGVGRWENAVAALAVAARAELPPVLASSEAVALTRPLSESALSLLSPAERDVTLLVASGRSNLSIARLRGTSGRTVANQVASVFRKLGVRSRLGLLLRLMAHAAPAVDEGAPVGGGLNELAEVG